MPSGSRRTHTKSRNGCAQCKARRIKCDERPPVCSNCERRKAKCEYETLFLPTFSQTQSSPPDIRGVLQPFRINDGCQGLSSYKFGTSTFTAEGHANTNSQNTSIYLASGFHLRDLELMHHFSVSTSLTISPSGVSRVQRTWQMVMPEEAQSHPYLMYIILAVAALHLAHVKGGSRSGADDPVARAMYASIAQGHHETALALFRSSVTRVDETNATAVFGFGALVAVYAYGLPRLKDPLSYPLEPLDGFVDLLCLFRQTWSLMQLTWPWLQHAPTSPVVVQHRGFLASVLPGEVETVLEELAMWNERGPSQSSGVNTPSTTTPTEMGTACPSPPPRPAEERRACAKAIEEMRFSFSVVPVSPEVWAFTLRWPMAVSPLFITMIQKRDPMALSLLALYCGVIMRRAPSRWFTQGWSIRVVEAIAAALPLEWLPAIRWAQEQVRDEERTQRLNDELRSGPLMEVLVRLDRWDAEAGTYLPRHELVSDLESLSLPVE
ncbi:hypothetical protein BDY21DRAFT_354248 [Lineolata rhizophorae]|uniref:Zn(2)-C6 fungal-type domain-containing protein n=1 Tax=Lineolata rhizophorae TaxID=578093 RepID=A0A6A6NSC6_9PEZI|nr:hypothetical protein BDY21DRAFT_354248 [Lineolata rhizophorae]